MVLSYFAHSCCGPPRVGTSAWVCRVLRSFVPCPCRRCRDARASTVSLAPATPLASVRSKSFASGVPMCSRTSTALIFCRLLPVGTVSRALSNSSTRCRSSSDGRPASACSKAGAANSPNLESSTAALWRAANALVSRSSTERLRDDFCVGRFGGTEGGRIEMLPCAPARWSTTRLRHTPWRRRRLPAHSTHCRGRTVCFRPRVSLSPLGPRPVQSSRRLWKRACGHSPRSQDSLCHPCVPLTESARRR